ncbi:putative oxidoreductase [Yersinia pestis biovar Medievalis str. Harbin 35]|nr:putative oxidoreductase [Yersinia pestis biovar Medievalis str. Harbin 35]AJJ42846.1 putative oxidoreductase [Yersinia pestis]AJK08050.1 putative oxidoreductase [Yersinia pestis]
MDYIKLGHCGLQVSRLCLGTMNMGSKQWNPGFLIKQKARH